MTAPAKLDHPTVQVAFAHVEAQGVTVSPECFASLHALFCPAQNHDDQALERLCILSSELAQQALLVAQSGTPQSVTFAALMLEIMLSTAQEVLDMMGGNHV